MYGGVTVAAVVPAYNEGGRVGEVIDTLPEYLDRAYVVDDASTDGTWTEVREHADRRNADHEGTFDDLVVPIRHERNRGVGGAIKTGYLRAREEGIGATAVLAGDGQMNPEKLPKYLDPIVEGRADYVKGNRFANPEDWADMPRVRLVGNVLLSYLTKVASGYWETMDSQNGYTAISLAALREADVEGMYEFYGYCNDLLVRLNVADVRVAEVSRSSSFVYEDGWHSHITLREYVPRVSAMLLRGFVRRLVRKYLLEDFHPMAVLYPLGTALSGAGLLGLLRALARREDGAAGWLLSTALGVLVFLYATVLDREENRHLAVEPGETTATAATAAGGKAGNGTGVGAENGNAPGTRNETGPDVGTDSAADRPGSASAAGDEAPGED